MTKNASAASAPPTAADGFERKLAELESLVEQLESGELALADALDRFRRGVELGRDCRAMLDEAQQLVDQLLSSDSLPADAEPDETSD